MISGLNHTALVHPVYASSNALPHSHARLGSGCWLGFTGRDSNPLNSNKWFPPASASPTTRFILALPDQRSLGYARERHELALRTGALAERASREAVFARQ